MELKGQMIHVPESCSLMFLGSPRVDKLEELMGRGLHLSDIPIHDATRDVILVGEQAKAQDGLKKRMDKLKVEWLFYSVSLLYSICKTTEEPWVYKSSLPAFKKGLFFVTSCEATYS